MDRNRLLQRHRTVLMHQEKVANEEERRAYRQFVRDSSVQIQVNRTESDPDVTCGFAA